MKKILIVIIISLVFFGGTTAANANTTYSLFGDGTIVSGGNPGQAANLVSDISLLDGYSGVEILPSSPIVWSNLTTLSTDYNITDDNCGGGSPRISIGIDTNNDNTADGFVHVTIGPSPNFTGCSSGWQSTGNLIGNNDAGRYDYSQFGGSPFTTYNNAPASVTSGKVVEVDVVVDGSWSSAATGGDSEQTILIDNIAVNSDITTFEPIPAPTVPQIFYPANGAILTQAQMDKVDWTDSTDATTPILYQYQAYSDPNYTSLVYDSGMTLTNSEIPTPGTPLGTYYLRVRAQGSIGPASDWSNGSDNPYKVTVAVNPFAVPEQCDQNISYNLINGTNKPDVINGTNGSDLIYGKDGADVIDGKGGNDCVVGDGGADVLKGSNGNDVIIGGNGADSIDGGNDNDTLYGDDGADSIKGGDGTDTINGGNGADAANGGNGTDTCTAEAKSACEI